MNEITIDCPLTSLNEYISAERRNRYIGAKVKKDDTHACKLFAQSAKNNGVAMQFPCFLWFEWHLRNAKKDPDNIAFAKKFILDGFQDAGVLESDTLKYIKGFVDTFVVDGTERVIVRELQNLNIQDK